MLQKHSTCVSNRVHITLVVLFSLRDYRKNASLRPEMLAIVPSIGELLIYRKWRIESSTSSKGYLINTFFFTPKPIPLRVPAARNHG